MCSDFPVEMIRRSENRLFIDRLNKSFRLAGKDIEFRSATLKEYAWAYTEGRRSSKVIDKVYKVFAKDYYVGPTNFGPISAKAPLNLDLQVYGFKTKRANSLSFKYSSVTERFEDSMCPSGLLVYPNGRVAWDWDITPNSLTGASRLVMVRGR